MAKSSKVHIHLEGWKQRREANIQKIRELNDEEATCLGRKEKLDLRLAQIRRERDGLEFAIVAGDEVAGMAMQEIEEAQKTDGEE